jgi:hypothetical protein
MPRKTPAKPMPKQTQPPVAGDAVTGEAAVGGLLGAVHRKMRRARERRAREAALRRPGPPEAAG